MREPPFPSLYIPHDNEQAPGRAFQLWSIYLEAELTVFDIFRIVFISFTDVSDALALRYLTVKRYGNELLVS